LGERYKHFLIDEFQDTSVMQWRNLLPLIHNSLSQGFFNMIVGDTKQSIYRWRNGEVEQFAALPAIYATEEKSDMLLEQEQSLISNYHPQNLITNFRSKEKIIQFNNHFFDFLSKATNHDFSRIYSDAAQLVAKNKEGGSVNIAMFAGEKHDMNDWMLNAVYNNVNRCLEHGYQKKDIAIITRSNYDGAAIAAHLMDFGIDVISKDSLLIGSSAEVRAIIEILRFMDNTANEISIAALRYFFVHHYQFTVAAGQEDNHAASLLNFFKANGIEFYLDYFRSLPLFELCTELAVLFGLNKTPNVYLKFFLDHIFAFGQHHSSPADLLHWWENKGQGLSIIVPDGVDAINIMTIHKSKGLQFPVVILPYADLFIKRTGIKHWCNIDEPEFPELKYALMNHSAGMEATPYAPIYNRESEKIILDQLNMLYVAFTRPEEHLFILSGSRQNGMHTYIEKYVTQHTMQVKEWNGVTYHCTGDMGMLPHQQEKAHETHVHEHNCENTAWRSLLKTSGYQVNNKEQDAQLMYGNLMHILLSEITHPNEVDIIIAKHEKTIQQHQLKSADISHKLKGVFGLEALRNYFDGSYIIKKETSVLNSNGTLLRPDMVAIKDNTAVIIDYKTGEPRIEYTEQLSSYAAVISQMGYAIEKRMIVYVDKPEIAYV
jgi:ATP-dependent exoDNAse (exonuclease V) beta subunit